MRLHFAAVDVYIDCSDGPLLGSAVGQLACDRGPNGRDSKVKPSGHHDGLLDICQS